MVTQVGKTIRRRTIRENTIAITAVVVIVAIGNTVTVVAAIVVVTAVAMIVMWFVVARTTRIVINFLRLRLRI